MNKGWIIAKRDLKGAFYAPFLYIIAGVFLFIAGWIFFNLLVGFLTMTQNNPDSNQSIAFVDVVINRFFGNLNFLFLFLVPLLAMNAISEEKKTGRFNVLLSSPINLWDIVLGKYLALSLKCLFVLSLTLLFPIVLWFAGVEHLASFGLGYLSLVANILCYLAIALFASALTKNNALALGVSIVLIMSNYLIAWAGQLSEHSFMQEIFYYLSLTMHFEELLKGVLSVETVFYYFAFIFIFVFLTKKKLESQQW